MSALHSWEDLGTVENDNVFAPDGSPDRLRRWRCRSCGWELDAAPDGSPPGPGRRFWRRTPGEDPREYDCDELKALQVMES